MGNGRPAGVNNMANDFDQFPIYDQLIKEDTLKMSSEWVSFMSSFFQNLTDYLSQWGIFVPLMTTAQRDTIQSPQAGQMIYNTTTDAPQIYQGGAWKTFTTS